MSTGGAKRLARKRASRAEGPQRGTVPAKKVAAKRAINVVPFNPLDKTVLGAAIAEVLLTTPVYQLREPFAIRGPGIYAIYYQGDFEAYGRLAEKNRDSAGRWPIYVGQALPAGGRRGIETADNGIELRNRIAKHGRSISACPDLNLDDFHYRALVLDDAFIRLGETSLLALYKPIWNNYVDGFGNNAQGSGRTASKRSRWDTLHGGRSQAQVHRDRDESREVIINEITQQLRDTNFDLPGTLISAAQQSATAMPSVDLAAAVNRDDPEATGEAPPDASAELGPGARQDFGG